MQRHAIRQWLAATSSRSLPLALALLPLPGLALAQTTANSSAYGAFVGANLLPILGGGIPITLAEVPTASGSAPPAYSLGPTLVGGTSVAPGTTGQILSTGIMEVSASSTVPGTDSASATATVNEVDLDVVGALLSAILTFDATNVITAASIGGECGALTASGTTTLTDPQTGGLVGSGQQVPVSPSPNLVLLDALGVRLVLNEQIEGGDGITSRSISVNGVHLELDVSLLGIGALTGDVVLAHAQGEIQCDGVPTPSPSATATPTPDGGGPTPTPTPGGGPTPKPDETPMPTPMPTPIPAPTPLPGDPGDDPFTNEMGVSTDRFAGATLNPGGVGQLLFGSLYDVRPVAGAGGSDAQHVNLAIVNVNQQGAENGGVLARVRFRESRTSREVFAFDVALSCAEVWAGSVSLNGSDAAAVPALRSAMPIVTGVAAGSITTGPALDPGNAGAAGSFSVPAGLTADDVRRGYLEVIAEEQLPCEPVEPGGFSRDGNTFARLSGGAATPPNSLAGQVFLVRASAGVSLSYRMPAIARFVIAGGGSIQTPVASGLPDAGSCVGWDASSGTTYTGLPECLDQLDLALSKARLHAMYDVGQATAGRAYLAVTLPTKGDHCAAGDETPSQPFRCSASGERVGCRIYDREENELAERPDCDLTRELTIFGIGGAADDPRADVVLGVGDFTSGWITLDLAADPLPGGTGVHEQVGLDPDLVDFLGVGRTGFRGLPALTLVIQEYFNGNVGGAFGNSVEAMHELALLPAEAS